MKCAHSKGNPSQTPGMLRENHLPNLSLLQTNLDVTVGATYEQRKQAYIADQGRAWEQWFPGAMLHPIWAWLEKPAGNAARISEEIGYLTHEGDHMGWKNA